MDTSGQERAQEHQAYCPVVPSPSQKVALDKSLRGDHTQLREGRGGICQFPGSTMGRDESTGVAKVQTWDCSLECQLHISKTAWGCLLLREPRHQGCQDSELGLRLSNRRGGSE